MCLLGSSPALLHECPKQGIVEVIDVSLISCGIRANQCDASLTDYLPVSMKSSRALDVLWGIEQSGHQKRVDIEVEYLGNTLANSGRKKP